MSATKRLCSICGESLAFCRCTEEARLRNEISELYGAIECMEEQVRIALDLAESRDIEIKKLKEEVDQERGHCKKLVWECEEKDAEIIRLRENQISGRCEDCDYSILSSHEHGSNYVKCICGTTDTPLIDVHVSHYCSMFRPQKN